MGQAESPEVTVTSDVTRAIISSDSWRNHRRGLGYGKKELGLPGGGDTQLVLEGGIEIFTRKQRDKEDDSEQRAQQVQR